MENVINDKELPRAARIGRPIEKTRLEVIELLITHVQYESGHMATLIKDAKEVIKFLEEDNTQYVNLT